MVEMPWLLWRKWFFQEKCSKFTLKNLRFCKKWRKLWLRTCGSGDDDFKFPVVSTVFSFDFGNWKTSIYPRWFPVLSAAFLPALNNQRQRVSRSNQLKPSSTEEHSVPYTTWQKPNWSANDTTALSWLPDTLKIAQTIDHWSGCSCIVCGCVELARNCGILSRPVQSSLPSLSSVYDSTIRITGYSHKSPSGKCSSLRAWRQYTFDWEYEMPDRQ